MKRFLGSLCAVLLAGGMMLPAVAAEGKIVYEERFETVTDVNQLGWEFMSGSTMVCTIEDGRLLVDNMAGGKDSYAVMVPDVLMREVIAGDYTVQYDLTYLDAGDSARYLAVLLNYDRVKRNSYNSLHIRIKGSGDWQTRRDGSWFTLDTGGVDGRQPIATKTASQTLAELAVGVPFDGSSYALKDQTFTVRQEVHAGVGVKIYVNDVFITGTTEAGWKDFMSIADPTTGGSEIALKAGATILAWFDNFVVATGIGIPVPETTGAPETAAVPTETAPQTEAPTESAPQADITVGQSVYCLALLGLGALIAVLVKRRPICAKQ